MRKILILPIVVFIFSFISCRENHVTSPMEPSNSVRSVEGKIELPASLKKGNFPELDVLSFHEKDDIDNDNTFDIDVFHSNTPQVVFAVNSNEDLVMGATVFSHTNSITINAQSTANSMILLNPHFFHASGDQLNEIIQIAPTCASYQQLVDQVSKLIIEDPKNVFNHEAHPKTIELAAKVGLEVCMHFENGGLLKSNNTVASPNFGAITPTTEIDNSKPGRIIFSNPNFVAISGEILNVGTYETSQLFSLAPRSGIVQFHFSMPPIRVTPPTKKAIDFAPNGRYTIKATKGFDLNKDFTQWFEWETPHGRATILNILLATKQVFKLVIGGTKTKILEEAGTKIFFHKDESYAALQNIVNGTDVYQKASGIFELLYVNREILIEAVLGTGFYFSFKDLISKVTKWIAGFPPAIKGAQIAFQLANETMPFVTDLFFGQRWFKFRVGTDQSGDIITHYPGEPGAPEIPMVSAYWFEFKQTGHLPKYYIRLSARSQNESNKSLKFNIVIDTKSYYFKVDKRFIYETKFKAPFSPEVYGDYKTEDPYNVISIQAEDSDGKKSEFSTPFLVPKLE